MGRLLLSFAALSMLLASCGEPKEIEVQQVPVTVEIREPLKYCPDAPEVPGEGASQKDVAAYVVALHNVYVICRLKLKTVTQIIDDFAAQISAREREFSKPRGG